VSSAAGEESGLASSFLGSIPARIPFGNKDVSMDPNFKMPDFPSFDLSESFEATSTGLLGTGISDINARTESDVNIILNGPDSFTGFPETIHELSDPTMGYILRTSLRTRASSAGRSSALARTLIQSNRQVRSSRPATSFRISRCL
jgi:hypothetical protein